MLKLVRFLKPYIWQIIALIILVVIQVDANLRLPDYTAKIVNQGIIGQDNPYIIKTGLMMLVVALIGGLCAVGVGYLAARIATGFSMILRNKVFSKVESFSLTEFNKFSTASLITRTTNDIQQIQLVTILILRLVISAPITGVWAIYKAYQSAPSMSWIMALAVVVMLGVIIVLFSIALPKFKLLQKMVDRLNLVTRENLTGLRVIRAFNNEKIEEGKFEKANVDLTGLNLFVNRLMVVMQPVMMLVLNISAVAIVWFGAHLINTGNLQIGEMIAFMQYAMQVIISFLMFSIVFILLPRAAVSADRIAEVIETKPEITDPEKPVKAKRGSGTIEFNNVTFCYPGAEEPVLRDISFKATSGQTTAFIGSTGSGKSTLINLIPRFFEVSDGEILIDGVNIKEMKLEDLYTKIGYVPQKDVLFSGTVESNINYGKPNATEKEINRAAQTAQAEEFVKKLKDKFKAPISQGGTNVSGGQKQRLSIARAIVRDPEIYIFDDSFSALDFKTDANLRKALKKETQNKTVLIVGQRVSTIMDSDQIVVLNEGRIVGKGTHIELLDNCTVYREIAESQLSKEELNAKPKLSEKKS